MLVVRPTQTGISSFAPPTLPPQPHWLATRMSGSRPTQARVGGRSSSAKSCHAKMRSADNPLTGQASHRPRALNIIQLQGAKIAWYVKIFHLGFILSAFPRILFDPET